MSNEEIKELIDERKQELYEAVDKYLTIGEERKAEQYEQRLKELEDLETAITRPERIL